MTHSRGSYLATTFTPPTVFGLSSLQFTTGVVVSDRPHGARGVKSHPTRMDTVGLTMVRRRDAPLLPGPAIP